jgi:hypothetical protein
VMGSTAQGALKKRHTHEQTQDRRLPGGVVLQLDDVASFVHSKRPEAQYLERIPETTCEMKPHQVPILEREHTLRVRRRHFHEGLPRVARDHVDARVVVCSQTNCSVEKGRARHHQRGSAAVTTGHNASESQGRMHARDGMCCVKGLALPQYSVLTRQQGRAGRALAPAP